MVESTFNWYWLIDGLMEAGYPVHLANPAKNAQYTGLKHSNDKYDAFWLAHLLRLNILAEGYIYPKEERAVRDFSNALAVSHQGDGHGRNREPKACTNHWTPQGTYVFLGPLPGESGT